MKLNSFSILISIFITMKNIFTTKVKWFKLVPTTPLSERKWTHTYTNMLGNPIKCIITKKKGNDLVWVLNENGCGVLKECNELSKSVGVRKFEVTLTEKQYQEITQFIKDETKINAEEETETGITFSLSTWNVLNSFEVKMHKKCVVDDVEWELK